MEKVTAPPQGLEQAKSPLQPEESGTTDQWEETRVAAKVKKHPVSGPSLRCQGHSSLDAPSELNPPQRIPSPLFTAPLVPQAEG